MESQSSEGLGGDRLSECSAWADGRHRPFSCSSFLAPGSHELQGHRHVIQQRRQQHHQQISRRAGFGELCLCTEGQVPSLSRKHSDRMSTENSMPTLRRGRSDCSLRTDGWAALSSMRVPGPSKAALCPLSLQVGMELALFAAQLESDTQVPDSISSNQNVLASSASAAYAAPTGSRGPLQPAEEPLSASGEAPGVPPSAHTTPSGEGSVSLPGLRAGRSQLAHSRLRFPFSLGSSAVWPKFLGAYGLADPAASRLVGILLRRALGSLRGSMRLLERSEDLPEGSLLHRALSLEETGSLDFVEAHRVPCAGAATRYFSSPLPNRSGSPCNATNVKSSPKQCGGRSIHEPMPLGAPQYRRRQVCAQSPGVQTQPRCQQQLTSGEQANSDPLAAVARIRTMLESHTETLHHMESSLLPASPPPSPKRDPHRAGRPLVRLQTSERAVAFPSLSAPPPLVSREALMEGERGWELAVTSEAQEGLPDGIAEGSSERPGGNAAFRLPEDCEEQANAAGSRRRSESAGPRTCEPHLLEPVMMTGNLRMSIRSRQGGLILQGRSIPNFREHQLSSASNNMEHDATPQRLGADLSAQIVPVQPAQRTLVLSSGQQQQATARCLSLETTGVPGVSVQMDGGAQTGDSLPQDDAQCTPFPVRTASSPHATPWESTDIRGLPQWVQRPPPNATHHPSSTPSRPEALHLQNWLNACSPELLTQGQPYQSHSACADRGAQAVNSTVTSQTQPLSTCTQQWASCAQQHLYDPRPQPSPRDGTVSVSWPCVPERPPSLRMGADRPSQPQNDVSARPQEHALHDIQQQHSGLQQLLYGTTRSHRRDGQQSPTGYPPELQNPLPLHFSNNMDRGSQTQDPQELQQRPRREPVFLQQPRHRQHMPHQQDGLNAVRSSAGNFPDPGSPEYLAESPTRRMTACASPLQQLQLPQSQPPRHAPRLGVTSTPMVPLRASYPHETLQPFERPTRLSAEAHIERPAYGGAAVPDSTASSTGGILHLDPTVVSDRGPALLARLHRGGSLSGSDANSGPNAHAVPGWVDVSSPVEQPTMQRAHYGISVQGQAGSRPQPVHEQQNQQVQQHIVEQWMRKTEAHMEGLERLMHRLMFILEAVEARELGLN